MHKLLIAAAAVALAAPAAAQTPEPGYPYYPSDPLAEEIARAIPPAEQIEAMAPVLDGMVGAMLDIDVGPIIDAADPYRRGYGHGRPGRTLGALGSRDDPYFEERLRSGIYGATADMGRMMHGFAAAAPALARAAREMERAMGAAMDDYHRRRGPASEEYEEPAPDDWRAD